jgi:G3E family GTPase
MAMTGFDRIIVEPSGIYDTDEFFDAMSEEPLCNWYKPGSLVAIVDAGMEEELSEESEYLLVSQTANAGKIVLGHCRDMEGIEDPAETKERILAHLNRAMERFQCDRRLTADDILAKDWEELTPEDYASIAMGGMIPADHVKIPVEHENGYGTLFYFGTHMPEEKLRECIARTMEDPACGNVMRIKGFVRTAEESRVQINATRRETRIQPTVFAREVLIVTGEDLHRDKINEIWAEDSEIITPGA